LHHKVGALPIRESHGIPIKVYPTTIPQQQRIQQALNAMLHSPFKATSLGIEV
jgi:hypothetical protein